MGTEANSVLDPASMRVHGVDGLRVVDAASMRYITNGNIYAPIMMLAEKAADLILGNTPLAPEPVEFFRRDAPNRRGGGPSPLANVRFDERGDACAAGALVAALGHRVRQRPDPFDDLFRRRRRRRQVCATVARACAWLSGEVPQQPPTIAAPPSTASRAYSAIRLGDPE